VLLEIVRNHVVLPVRVAGSEPFRVILDTGMPTRGLLLFASDRVDGLGLTFAPSRAIAGAGGRGERLAARVAPGVGLVVGDQELADVRIIVLERPAGLPRDWDGVIGNELFERFAVRIDADGRRLSLGESPAAPDAGTSVVPLHLREGKVFVNLRVAVDEGEPQPVELAVDLGASHALWLNARPDGSLAPPPGGPSVTLGRGLSGDIRGRQGRVRRLEIGGFSFADVVALFPDPEHRNPGGADFRDGFVGNEILTRFDLTFDYPASRLLLRPGRRLADPFEADMSGLLLDPAAEGRIPVLDVLPDSPAAEAGILAGDVLLALDGVAVGTLGPDALRAALEAEAAEVHLLLARGDVALEKRLRLRRLV
jgi:hypothetical protein